MKQQIVDALEASGNSGQAMVEALQALGFQHTYSPIGGTTQVWEHPALAKQDIRGARIMSAHFCTLYELTVNVRRTVFMFVIGRMGNTSTYELDFKSAE